MSDRILDRLHDVLINNPYGHIIPDRRRQIDYFLELKHRLTEDQKDLLYYIFRYKPDAIFYLTTQNCVDEFLDILNQLDRMTFRDVARDLDLYEDDLLHLVETFSRR